MFGYLLLKGALIGFSIAMPVGPIGLLCIRNSLDRGMRYGLATGLGAATADALFASLAAFGMTAIGIYLSNFQGYLQIVGALFLLYLGISTFRENPQEMEAKPSLKGTGYAFASTFFLTLVNPLTILSFAAIYAGTSFNMPTNNWIYPAIVTAGIFLGSALWWLLLSASAAYFKDKISIKTRKMINRASGLFILAFGCWMLIF